MTYLTGKRFECDNWIGENLMKMVIFEEIGEELNFVKKAAKYFAEHPKITTYTLSDIEPGCLFGLKFGLGDDCVVVFRIAEDCEVKNFQQIINKRSMDKKLWCDLKTDQEKADYFRSGQIWKYGLIPSAIENEIADAFQFRANYNARKFKKEEK